MKQIETSVEINASVEKVWEHIINFEEYPHWNPFIRSIQKDGKSENHLKVSIQLPGKKTMNFRPKIIKFLEKRELRWKGKLLIKGLFDGEHYLKLEETANNKTRFIHGEKFSGIFVPFLNSLLKRTEDGFEQMNLALKERCERN